MTNTNRKIDEIFPSIYYDDIYQSNFSSLNSSVNTDRNISTVYTEEITVEKERIKKSQTVRWHVSFTHDVTDRINSTVKFVHKYAYRKLSSVYTDDITEGIIVGFKKEICTVTWHFYRLKCRRNNFIGKSICNI